MHDTPESKCLGCGEILNAATNVTADEKPDPGDVTICLKCGHIMAFAADLTMRALTDAEMHAVAGDKRILMVQRARAELEDKLDGW